ncbi:class I SAM-dependent methyltransferase [Bacteroidales bacterium OttesenSCG-928-A17]|nr:class I SAM-dependent methyltransferase [Bacteroidales bacterium OttesenSCG-928-A17]
MNSLKNHIKNLQWKSWMRRGKSGLDRQNPFADKIYQAIDDTIEKRFDDEELKLFDSIEKIRQQFHGNPTPISVVDFGAGGPKDTRSQEEMLSGVSFSSTYGNVCEGSKPQLWAILLAKLIRYFQPETGIELGTCIGISAAYEAGEMELNGRGKLYTLEGSSAIADLAKKNLRSLNLSTVSVITGRFCDTLPRILKGNTVINYVFIDGHHDEEATWNYYQSLLPFLSSGALLVFDDISWSRGMKRVWKKIKSDNNISLSVDLKMIGICIVK